MGVIHPHDGAVGLGDLVDNGGQGGDEIQVELPLQPLQLLPGLLLLLLGQLPHLGVRQQLLGLGTVVFRLLPGPEGGCNGGQLLLLPAQAGEHLPVGVYRRVGQLALHLVQPPDNGL